MIFEEPTASDLKGQAAQRPEVSVERLTVLQVVPAMGAGGVEQSTVDIVQALVSEGHRALVATKGGFRTGEIEAAGGEVVLMDMATKHPYSILAANVMRLAHLIDEQDVDVVHARSRAPAWSARIAARLMGRRFVTTYHGTYNARGALKRFYNSVMAKGDAVIANSQFIAKHILRQHRLPLDAIDIIPRGIDMTRFDPACVPALQAQALRGVWLGTDAPGNRHVILMPGRLTHWKGQTVFLDALGHLVKMGEHTDDWCAVLMGDAQGRKDYADGLKAQARDLGIADKVVFQGHVQNMPAAYRAADLVVSPAIDPEAFGRVAVEAQAMERPIIAADHGGTRETVIDMQEGPEDATGWRVAPGDPRALAQALNAALDLGESAREAMGKRGRAYVGGIYTLDAMQKRTLSVYHRVMEKARRR